MKAFRFAYGQDSTILAKCSQDATNNPDYMVSNDPSYNPLINSNMFQLLYSRDIFSPLVKTEGSFSNARAMAQLRQYYMRMIDFDDSQQSRLFWES